MATSPMEIRMAHLEGAYEQINTRLGGIEERLGRVEDKIETKIDGLRSELLSRMDRQSYWILSLVVISILVPIFLRLLNN